MREETPSVIFTSIHFNLSYEGNESGYISPMISWVNNVVLHNNTDAVNIVPVGGNGNPWVIYAALDLQLNSSTSLGSLILDNGFATNSSAMLDNLTVNTAGFGLRFGRIMPPPFQTLPVPILPGYCSNIPLTVQVNTMHYDGPLNLSITVSTPEQGIVSVAPDATTVNGGNHPVAAFVNEVSYSGVPVQGNHYLNRENGTETEWVYLMSNANFTISSVSVNLPFRVLNTSYGNASPSAGLYYLFANIPIVMPNSSGEFTMFIKIYTVGV